MLVAAPLAAQPDVTSVAERSSPLVHDLPSWWGQAGYPGGPGSAWVGGSMPWTLAGLAVGAWGIDLHDGIPDALPAPGVIGIHPPLAWQDSIAARFVEGAAWGGFGTPLAVADGVRPRSGARRGRAVVDVRGGDFGLDENGLTIARGDSIRWFAAEVAEGGGGAAAGFEEYRRHLWGFNGAWGRRRHRLEGGFRQRSTAAILGGGEEQSASAQSGYLQHRYEAGAATLALTFRRGLDQHASFGPALEGSRRDAQANEFEAEGHLRRDDDALAVHGRWRDERIRRAGPTGFTAKATSGWASGAYERRVGVGRLLLGLGAGNHGAVGGLEIAPEVAYRTGAGPFEARIGFERLLHPVWSDLAENEEAFLQQTWAGAFDIVGRWSDLRARARVIGGRTTDRALVQHLPLEDLWLRAGAVRDLEPYRFGIAAGEGTWTWRVVTLHGEGYALSRERTGDEAQVDPSYGLRGRTSLDFTAFSGDLGVHLNGQLDRIGPREVELSGFFDQRLPAHWTASSAVAITLADAVISIAVRNIEDRPREDVWIDNATGEPARGPGREWRFALSLRLAN